MSSFADEHIGENGDNDSSHNHDNSTTTHATRSKNYQKGEKPQDRIIIGDINMAILSPHLKCTVYSITKVMLLFRLLY